ncbi:MAG: toll/interleukin-1 receptor domain-containing protein [Parvularculaceae bacterium]|nr:toll/interleukin-1 receptor domain-containing protein [Parvularculaceae bacterium]
MTRIFVSYAREDKDRVAKIVAFAGAIVDEVWWDDRLVAGESFTEETERRLNEADFVVVVWTPNSVRSKWVLDEAAVGRDAGKLVPLSFDGQAPPLGFRHVHCTDFSGWRGGGDERCALALKEALTRGAKARVEPAPVASAPRAGLSQRRLLWRLAFAVLGVFAIALVGGLMVGALSILKGRDANAPSIAEVTADLIAGRTPDDPYAAAAKRAVEAIGGSDRAEDRAALSSFAAGDETGALDILERLAGDLERAGDKNAAAEAYTRVGAIALLVDQGRGLAARRKALELSPESLPAFQGLFFDIFLMRGYEAAAAFAEEAIARRDASDRFKGYAYAHLAIIAMDAMRDEALAEERIARVRALFERTKDPILEAAALYAAATVDWRRDRLAEAEREADAADAVTKDGERAFPAEVVRSRIKFSQGDWEGAFAIGLSSLEARRRAGGFLPTPLLQIACRSGLFLGEVENAAPYCAAQEGRSDQSGGAGFRIVSGELALARGDVAKARSELSASRALAGENAGTGSAGEAAILFAEQLRLEAAIAAAAGDLDGAQSLIWRHIDAVAGEPNARSLRAGALRLYGLWAMKRGAPERACAPLQESAELYAAVGGAAGAAAARAARAKAGCK